MFCANCGQELPANAKFCPKCGSQTARDSVEPRTLRAERDLSAATHDNSKRFLSNLLKRATQMIIIIFLCFAGVIGSLIVRTLMRAGTGDSSKPSAQAPAPPTDAPQQIGEFSVRYLSAFSRNDKNSEDMLSAVEAQAPGSFQSIDIYSSSADCGIDEVNLSKSVYAKNTNVSIDGASKAMISQISSLEGIVNPEDTVSVGSVSGYPASKTSFRARRWGGVLGAEILTIADTSTDTLWQLQLLFSSKNTNDYSTLIDAKSCAQTILNSVTIEQSTKEG